MWSRVIRCVSCSLRLLLFHKSRTVIEYGVSLGLQLRANQSTVPHSLIKTDGVSEILNLWKWYVVKHNYVS